MVTWSVAAVVHGLLLPLTSQDGPAELLCDHAGSDGNATGNARGRPHNSQHRSVVRQVRMAGPRAVVSSTFGSSVTGITAVTHAYPSSSNAASVCAPGGLGAGASSRSSASSPPAPTVIGTGWPISSVSDVCEEPTGASSPTRSPRSWS